MYVNHEVVKMPTLSESSDPSWLSSLFSKSLHYCPMSSKPCLLFSQSPYSPLLTIPALSSSHSIPYHLIRYLYSTERNRRQFQTLFPPELYAAFIDVGNYVRQSAVYSSLVHTVNTMTVRYVYTVEPPIKDTLNKDALAYL